ncbi:hypothetical protein [Alkalibacillus aidingensis]|uniref:hypothetical protein n=1 Tax=Alkalibacillus aidingensis TaxID=2747607 RepID=UPI001660A46D|nr:hypothetical protein [Alkalibacillus aidingensis]
MNSKAKRFQKNYTMILILLGLVSLTLLLQPIIFSSNTEFMVIINLALVLGIIVAIVLLSKFHNGWKSSINQLDNIAGQLEALNQGIFSHRLYGSNDYFDKVIKEINQLARNLQNSSNEFYDYVNQVQRLSFLMNEDAEKTVQQLYDVSIELTENTRRDLELFEDFLASFESHLQFQATGDTKLIEYKLKKVKELANEKQEEVTTITLTLSDLVETIEQQATELSDVAEKMIEQMDSFNQRPDHQEVMAHEPKD